MRPNTFSINSIFFAITIAVISIMAWTLVGNYSDYFDRVYTEYKENLFEMSQIANHKKAV